MNIDFTKLEAQIALSALKSRRDNLLDLALHSTEDMAAERRRLARQAENATRKLEIAMAETLGVTVAA